MTAEPSISMAAPDANSRTADATNMAYILSANFSGSTLLAMLLGSQAGACTVGEMRAPALGDPDVYLCSCGEPIKKCGFWAEVSKLMAKRGIANFDITRPRISIHDTENRYVHRLLAPLPRGPLLEVARGAALSLSPEWPAHLREMHRRNGALVEVLQEMTNAKVVVDSSKIALHLKYLLRNPDLKIKVIRLVRDGRAVANSMVGRGTKNMHLAADGWRRNNEAAEHVLAGLPASQCTHLQYEELCRRPEETLRSLCKFLGMDIANIVLDFRSHTQHILGNDMRLKSGSEIRVDERWRTSLSKENLAIFEEIAGDMNRKYGYQ